MSNQTLNATAFEYSILYFNTTFEDILAGIVVVYSCIIATKIKVPLNDENAIRDIFLSKEYLKNIDFRKSNPPLDNYHFDKETSENQGRADIRVLQIKPYKDDDAYYVIECKRLDSENQNGKSGLNGEYISNGIARFVSGKYSMYNNTAGMIGFVVSKMDICVNVCCINKLLQNTFTEINTEKQLTKKQITPDFEYSYYSNHKVGKSTKIIYHLMFNFSANTKIGDNGQK
ncbi:MAG: hypothetical protein LBN95_02595 [Prevotellaceae bacterium]|jgi:hypothetical protein|nr:hypothetical protein [Prevotellaceae bacterium]